MPKDASGFRFEDFVVTAFRIDPCAPTLAMDEGRAPASGAGSPAANAGIKTTIGSFFGAPPGVGILPCIVQIRLIAQPVVPFTNFTQIDESSVHLVYRLNGDSRAVSPNGIMGSELAKDILLLKTVSPEPTTGLPLQEHPGLYKEGKTVGGGNYGGFASAVITVLKKYIQPVPNGPSLLPANVAVMRSFRNGQGEKIDVMFAGGTDSSKKFTPVPMPTSPKKPTRFLTVTSSADRSDWSIRPIPEQANVMDLMINKRLNFGLANINTLMNFDNPETTHFFGTDCLSCHGTSQMMKEGKIQNQDINVASRYPSPPGVTGYPLGKYLPDLSQTRKGVVVRNFGWSGSMPIIGNRTVTETASVVNYLNHNILNVPNPGSDCGTSEPTVWKNFVNLDQNFNLDAGASANRKTIKSDVMSTCSSNLTSVPQRIAVTAQGNAAAQTAGATATPQSQPPVVPPKTPSLPVNSNQIPFSNPGLFVVKAQFNQSCNEACQSKGKSYNNESCQLNTQECSEIVANYQKISGDPTGFITQPNPVNDIRNNICYHLKSNTLDGYESWFHDFC